VEAETSGLMLKVTWEWLGQDPALDIANTVAIVDGGEHDMVADAAEYERWAGAEAAALGFGGDGMAALVASRSRVLELRAAVRAVVAAAAAGRPTSSSAVAELNRASRGAPEWLELDPVSGDLRRSSRASAADALIATYARAAMSLVGEDDAQPVRRCPAPSCGMFYRPSRTDQHWCSPQCGSRARVARHYRAHKNKS
jgi:predicted RNA-binding Zn ribbon-like protein